MHGNVQGVGFRMNTMMRADDEGVVGWVKNQYDGSVSAWFEGDPDSVQHMVDWCRSGSRFSDVAQVHVTERSPEGHRRFIIR